MTEKNATSADRKPRRTSDAGQLIAELLGTLKKLEATVFKNAGQLSLQLREPNAAHPDGRFEGCVVFSPYGPGESKILYELRTGDTVKSILRELLEQVVV